MREKFILNQSNPIQPNSIRSDPASSFRLRRISNSESPMRLLLPPAGLFPILLVEFADRYERGHVVANTRRNLLQRFLEMPLF